MEKDSCKICGAERNKIFSKKILGKYNISYYQCSDCGFVQTEKPYWLQESYSSAITSMDIGLIGRNIYYSDIVENLIYDFFKKKERFLDFAGGYGIFTRIMRDKGFDFYREDKYCENLFAKHFDISDLPREKRKFELVTAFEFMEHIEDPFRELEKVFSLTDNFLFSTELVPKNEIENWWYLASEHGQHISFYTKKSLEKIANKFNKNLYSNSGLHLLTNQKNPLLLKNLASYKRILKKLKEKISPPEKLKSRLQDDFQMVKNKLKESIERTEV